LRPSSAFQFSDLPPSRDPGNGPETFCSKPKGYPCKAKAAALILRAGQGSSFLRACRRGGCSLKTKRSLNFFCILRAAAKRSAEQFPPSPRDGERRGIGGRSPHQHGSSFPRNSPRLACKTVQASLQKNKNEGGCGRRSQSKPRIPAVPNSDVQSALAAPVMKSGTHGGLGFERIQLGLRVGGRPQQSG